MATFLTLKSMFLSGTLLLVVWLAIFLYNSLVQARARAREAWAGIEVQLKRRADLVPNLLSAIKGYTAHELQLLDEVSQRRAEVVRTANPVTAGQADLALGASLRHLLTVAENYPGLKASDNFLELQKELADVEEKIAYARRFYNQSAQEYNIRIQSFPSLILARLCRFRKVEYFQAEAFDRKTVQKSSNY